MPQTLAEGLSAALEFGRQRCDRFFHNVLFIAHYHFICIIYATAVDAGAFVVEFAGEVRFDRFGQMGLETQAVFFRLVENPLGGAVAQAPFLVAAADVAVHAREPDLLQVQAGFVVPERGLEVLAVFVDGNRVAGSRFSRPQLRMKPASERTV